MIGDAIAHTVADTTSKLHLLATMVDQNPLWLTKHIQRIVRDETVAEDLSQDALVRAIHGLPDYRGGAEAAQLYSWLDQIGRNLAYNYLRDRGRRPRQASLEERCHDGESLAEQLTASMADPALISSQAETYAHLVTLIRNLPTDARKVFLLRTVEGLSTAATAEILQISEDMVKWRLHRTRKVLRQQLLASSDLSALF